jgi:hypothetical protein
MDEPAAFLIGRESDDHLRVTVLRRITDSPDAYWFDYGSLQCRIEIHVRGMRADFETILRAEEIDALRHDLSELDRAFNAGAVRFEPAYERALEFSVTVADVGSIGISGLAIDGLGTGIEQRLRFDFGVADTLRSILGSVESVARAIPTIAGVAARCVH